MLIRESVTRSVQGSVRDVLTIACLGVVMFIQDWLLALDPVHGAAGDGAVHAEPRDARRTRPRRAAWTSTGDLATHLSETLDGRRVVKAYRMEDHAIARATHIVGERMKHLMKGASARAAATPSAEVLAGAGIAAVIFYAAYRGMDIASFTSFLAAMMLSYQSIRTLSNFYTALSEGSAAAARAYALLDAPSDIAETASASGVEACANRRSARRSRSRRSASNMPASTYRR